MKKLLSPLPAGGFPLVLEDILNLQDQVYATISQLYGAVATSFVVSGCTVASSNAGASTCVVGPGYVWLNNELRYFPGYTGSYPFYVVSAPDQLEPRTYSNGAVQNSYTTKTATTSPTSPGPGNSLSLLFNPGNTTQRLIPLVTAAEATTRANADQVLTQALQDETSARTDAYNDLYNTLTALQNQLTSLTQTVNTKVTRVKVRTEWTDLVLNAPFFYDTSNTGFYRPQFMRTEDGFIHLRGMLSFPAGASTGSPFANLPAGHGTLLESRFTHFSSTGSFTMQLSITGTLLYAFPIGTPPSTGSPSLFLDGITFYNDLN